MSRESYKNFIIEAKPIPMANSKWRARFTIENHQGGSFNEALHDPDGYYPTRQDAVEASMVLGRAAIDQGNVPPMS